jgi:exonuclease SbcD
MRFIHTADWHLGKLFYGVHLTEDQAHLLNQLVDLAAAVKPDAVLISGDIYDRAVPPPEAVALLDDTLTRLICEVGTRVVLVAGNHDSPERLGFGARIFQGRRLHVQGRLNGLTRPLTLEDRHGPLEILALPYVDPAQAREWIGAAEVCDHNQAVLAVLARARGGPEAAPTGLRSILVTHAFVAGGLESESERPLTVGGAAAVKPSTFGGFSYAALGHLHRPQSAGAENIRYAGALFKYSFDEAAEDKTVEVVEIDGAGAVRRESVPLRPRRDVRQVSGRFADLLRGPGLAGAAPGLFEPGDPNDYLLVTLLDDGPVLEAMARLREVYPNILSLGRGRAAGRADGPEAREAAGGEGRGRRSEREMFGDFYADVTGAPLGQEHWAALDGVLEDLRRAAREVGP